MMNIVGEYINRVLSSARFRRMSLVLSGLFLLFSILYGLPFLASKFPRVFAVCILIAIAAQLATLIRRSWVEYRKRWGIVTVRCIRVVRKTFGMLSFLKLAYMTALLMGTLDFLYFSMSGNAASVHVALLGASFVVIGFLDFLCLAIKLTRFAWARTLGKAALAVVSISSAWLASVMADHAIGSVTAMDPKNFDVTAKLLAGVLSPAIYVGICAMIVLIMASLFFVAFILAVMIYQQVSIVSAIIPRRRAAKKASVAYRLIHGKNRPAGARSSIFDWSAPILLVRPLLVVAASCALLSLIGQVATVDGALRQKILSTLIAAADFHGNHRCTNIPSTNRVHYLGDDKVLVASGFGGDWQFASAECDAP